MALPHSGATGIPPASLRTGSLSPPSTLGGLELVTNPLVDVAQSVADVLSDPEAGWTPAGVAPGVEGGHRHLEVFGELPRC